MQVLKEAIYKENFGKDFKHRVWVNFKSSIEKRVQSGFLFGLCSQLIEWKFPKESVRVEPETGLLKISGFD